LVQPGEFASKERVTIVGPKREIKNVRILGPFRKFTQIEISRTDAITLGVNAPVRESGDIKGSAPIKIIGPAGEIELKEGCIVARRHIHMTPQDAKEFKVNDKDIVRVEIPGERGGHQSMPLNAILIQMKQTLLILKVVDMSILYKNKM